MGGIIKSLLGWPGMVLGKVMAAGGGLFILAGLLITLVSGFSVGVTRLAEGSIAVVAGVAIYSISHFIATDEWP